MNIILGTVQFGIDYGIANKSGQVEQGAINEILKYAKKAGVINLDTAIAYGDSEKCLGSVGVSEWDIISKLPPIPENCLDVTGWVNEQIEGSLQRLQVDNLMAFMLHEPKQLLKPYGRELWEAMQSCKKKGIVKKIGLSIYSPQEIEIFWNDFKPDIIQAPFNIIDQRMDTTGWLKRLHDANIEVHIRSIFLQGLLLMNKRDRNEKFYQWNSTWKIWDKWLYDEKLTPLEACIGFINSKSIINHVVVGVETLQQLEQIVCNLDKTIDEFPKELISTDENLIIPSNWAKL